MKCLLMNSGSYMQCLLANGRSYMQCLLANGGYYMKGLLANSGSYMQCSLANCRSCMKCLSANSSNLLHLKPKETDSTSVYKHTSIQKFAVSKNEECIQVSEAFRCSKILNSFFSLSWCLLVYFAFSAHKNIFRNSQN